MNAKQVGGWIVLLMAAALLAGAVGFSISGNIQRDPMQAQAADLYNQIRCPVCDGQTIAASDTGPSVQMRQEIRRMLEQGSTPEEIKQHYRDRYGQWILTEPPARGAALLAWWLPGLVLLAGGVVLARYLKRSTSEVSVASEVDPARTNPGVFDTLDVDPARDELTRQLRDYL